MNSGLFSSVCSQLRESLPGVATSSAAAHHLILPLLLDVQAAPAKGAAVVSSSQAAAAVSEPLKQEEGKEEEEEERREKCKLCGETFLSKKELLTHLKNHKRKKLNVEQNK